MAITIFRGMGGEHFVSSHFLGPSILLDNCALQLFAENKDLADLLVDSLATTQATVCLSGLNMGEMTKGSLDKHAIAVDRLLSRIFSHLFFIEHSTAITQTATYLEPRPIPPADHESALEVVKRYWNGGQARAGRDGQDGLFSMIWSHRDRMEPTVRKMAENIANTFLEHRDKPDYVEKVRKYEARAAFPRVYTVVAELMRDLMLSPEAKIPPNHSIDLIHATVGLVFCDYVALDGGWFHRATIARQRMPAMSHQLGMPFRATPQGLKQLLETLDASIAR